MRGLLGGSFSCVGADFLSCGSLSNLVESGDHNSVFSVHSVGHEEFEDVETTRHFIELKLCVLSDQSKLIGPKECELSHRILLQLLDGQLMFFAHFLAEFHSFIDVRGIR